MNHAVAMHFLKLSYMQKVGVLHTDENTLHVSRIAIEREDDGDHITLEYAGSRSIKEAGWDSVTNEMALSLYRDALLPRPDKSVLTYLNRALTGLLGGILPTDIPTDPGLHLSYGLLTKKLARELGERIRDETSVKLRHAADALKLNDAPFFITAGPFFMIGQFEKLMLNPVGKYQPARVRNMLAMERTAYGIVAMLNWLREKEDRRITVRHKYSIRIAAKEDDSIELIPGSLFQSGRERRTIKQILSLDSEYAMDRDLLVVNILWGNNPIPRYNTSLCTLSYVKVRMTPTTVSVTLRLSDCQGFIGRFSVGLSLRAILCGFQQHGYGEKEKI